MRISKRGVGDGSTVAGKVSVKVLKSRRPKGRGPIDARNDELAHRDQVLEKLSAAAREALRPPDSVDGG